MDTIVNLKRFREKYNLTQAKAAEAIGIDQRQWNHSTTFSYTFFEKL